MSKRPSLFLNFGSQFHFRPGRVIYAISYFLLQPELLLLCHQLYMDECLCSWAPPATCKGRNGILKLWHMGTGTHSACLARPENVIDFLAHAQNCPQSQGHRESHICPERKGSSLSVWALRENSPILGGSLWVGQGWGGGIISRRGYRRPPSHPDLGVGVWAWEGGRSPPHPRFQ